MSKTRNKRGGARAGAGAPAGNQNAAKETEREKASTTLAPGTKALCKQIAVKRGYPGWGYAVDEAVRRLAAEMEMEPTSPPPVDEAEMAVFCRQHRIRWLALFGSAVKGKFGPESDVDVLVEFEPEARLSLLDFIGVQQALSDFFDRPVDLVERDSLKPVIKDEVLASARVIYAA